MEVKCVIYICCGNFTATNKKKLDFAVLRKFKKLLRDGKLSRGFYVNLHCYAICKS